MLSYCPDAQHTLLDGVRAPLMSSMAGACLLSAETREGNPLPKCGLALRSSSSGTGASLLGTGVRLVRDAVALKFGLLDRAFRGLVRSGSLTVFTVAGPFEKNDWILFWPADDPDFFNVAGVGAVGVEDFFAIFTWCIDFCQYSQCETSSKGQRHYYLKVMIIRSHLPKEALQTRQNAFFRA